MRNEVTTDFPANMGKQCPHCGNPIVPMLGNKFQEETDYKSPVSPLTFVRSYNSALRMADNAGSYFGVGAYSTAVGNGGTAKLFKLDGQSPNGRNPLIRLDTIGANWRHTYQRMVYFETASGLSVANVYRPDGRVLTFTLYSGQFVAAPFVSDRLETISGGGYTFTDAATQEVETYSSGGMLLSIRYLGGQVVTMAYDTCGRLSTATDSFGHALTFTYEDVCGTNTTNARIATMTDPAGGVYTYSYDGSNLLSVTYPDMKARTYGYGAIGPSGGIDFKRALVSITDENNAAYASWTYSTRGMADSSSHAGGADAISIVYNDGPGCGWQCIQNATVTDAAGGTMIYFMTGVGGKALIDSTRRSDASGTGTVNAYYTYDANGNTASYIDYKGRETRHTWDLARNLETSRTEAYGTARARTTTTIWNSTFRLPQLITEPNRTTGFTYDTAGNMLTRTVTDTASSPTVARTWTYTYNSFGKMLTEDGPRTDVSDVTTYTYYSCATGGRCGQVQTVTNAASQTTTFNTYNAHGQPLTITDPNSVVTTLTYDSRQRLTSRDVAAELTIFTYWPTGLLKRVTLPDSSYLEYTYDTAHRLTQIADGGGNLIAYTLDGMGNRTAEKAYDPSSALSRQQTRVFDSLNHLWKQIGAAGTAAVTTVFAYDNADNQVVVNGPLSRNTGNVFDELNRLHQVTDPLLGVTTFEYDANDNLTSVTDPRSLVTGYVYNGFGDLKQQTSPDTGTTYKTYDSGGNLKTSTDARSIQGTYNYDALNRLSSLVYPDATLSFTYDSGTNGVGRLSGVSDANHSLSWIYDAQGRVTSKSQIIGGTTRTVGYGYTNGNMTSIVTPSGQTIAYGYSQGRVSSVSVNGTTVLHDVLYEPFGPVRQWTWGNALSLLNVRVYDLDGNTTAVDTGLLTGESYGYGYDDAFRVTSVTNTAVAAQSWTYTYDVLDRLKTSTSSVRNESWTYDANGNRLTQTGSAPVTVNNTLTVASTNNRISAVSGTRADTYGYDFAGNVTSQSNPGRSVSLPTTTTTTYKYNALSQRIQKTVGSASTYFVYDEAGHLLGEYGTGGALIEETVWLGDIPVATLRPKSGGGVDVFYVHTDHLNAPRKITRPSDNVVLWRWDPAPFGDTLPDENPEGAGAFRYNLRFPGQYYDPESGLSYNSFRDYDPALGRYLESDPIGLEGGINTYAYVGGNPIVAIDPSGTGPIGQAIGSGVGGFLGGLGGGIAGGAIGVGGGTLVAPGVGTIGGGVAGAEVGAVAGAAGGAIVGGYLGDQIGDAIDSLVEMAAPGRQVDSQIEKDYGEAASAAKLCGQKPPDRCDWLAKNASKYRPDQVKATQKAWGCRRSRAAR